VQDPHFDYATDLGLTGGRGVTTRTTRAEMRTTAHRGRGVGVEVAQRRLVVATIAFSIFLCSCVKLFLSL